jgi:hypothetical protein
MQLGLEMYYHKSAPAKVRMTCRLLFDNSDAHIDVQVVRQQCCLIVSVVQGTSEPQLTAEEQDEYPASIINLDLRDLVVPAARMIDCGCATRLEILTAVNHILYE